MNILIKIYIFLYASLNLEKESEKGEARGRDWGGLKFINLMTCFNKQQNEHYCIKVFHCHSGFFFYDGPVDKQIRVLLANSKKKESLRLLLDL